MKNVSLRTVLLVTLLAVPVYGAFAADETNRDGLQLDYSLEQRSLEMIADGTAADGVSRLAPAPVAAQPQAGTPFPLLVPGLFIAVAAAFAAGMWLARRRAATPAADAPVALWLDAEQLQADLEQRDIELAELQNTHGELVAEREQLLLAHADEVHELRGEKEELQRELHALRLRDSDDGNADAQATIDALRGELAELQSDTAYTLDRREMPPADAGVDELRAELAEQKQHIRQLEALLQEAHDESVEAEQRLSRLSTLEDDLASRDHDLREAADELSRLRHKAEQLDEQENRVALLDSELATLRDEMNELLGKTGQYQVLVPELENKLFHRQEQIGALESDLQATASEVAERDRTARQLEENIGLLQQSLTEAEDRISSLESDLGSALAENELLRLNPDTEELHHENIRLKSSIENMQRELAAARSEFENVQQHRERLDEWNTTVTSLQAEIRRKSTLIDSQADHLSEREKLIAQLRVQVEDLRGQLAVRGEESEALRGLLEEAGNVVVSLRDEIGQEEHAATRLRLARDPAQDPFTGETGVNPVEADIEALRFTARSRRDLGNSLETILAEERTALEQATRRVREHDEQVVALKNDISANRVAMVALRARLADISGSDAAVAITPGREPARVEQELQQSMKVLEALRADLHKWRGRVKPLHEALVARNERIQYLEAEVAALRQAQGLEQPAQDDNRMVDDVSALLQREKDGESPEAERARCLDEMKREWDRIVALESDLAETGSKLARVLELDDSRCRQIESLELARSAQQARLAELRTKLASHGIDTDAAAADVHGNVVDLGARRPS